ncbi:hypothetical protein B0H21DRAFT_168925 [Amylocystis lapponica]|nr:hypothetical protein B0H21DRAFT_168925 [Amylocystis lapponica]
MLFSVPLALVGASLALQAGAAPLRVVVVTSHQEVSTHAGPVNDASAVAHIMHVASGPGVAFGNVFPPPTRQRGAGRHFCAAMKDRIVNLIFGHPPPPRVMMMHAEQQEDNLPTASAPSDFWPLPTAAAVASPDADASGRPTVYRHPYEHSQGSVRIKHFHEHMRGPFLRRIYFALHHLGPWEGRAVAFVFGCGIGVLLRMMWVLAVVMVRAVKTRTSSAPVALDEDAEEIVFEAPPQYVDEKVAVTDVKTVVAN